MARVKTVFHVHTDHSDDSNASVESILELALARGVGCVTITDHDTMTGARAMSRIARGKLQVIQGQEVSTREGHLIGLFLQEEIEPRLPARMTAELIKRQGGLVIAPHPFNSALGCSLGDHVYELVDLLDAVEVCNAQNLLKRPNRRSAEFAHRNGLPEIVGADAHHRGHLDACYQLLRPFKRPEQFLESLADARLVHGRHSLGYFFRSARVILSEKTGLRMPRGYGVNCTVVREKPGWKLRSAKAGR
jgi:predicted metal-dependent phosphoesterase TrpH